MHPINTAFAFKQAAETDEKLAIDPAILAWFKQRGAGWKREIEDVLDFYIHTVEQPASVPDAFEPGEMDPAPHGP